MATEVVKAIQTRYAGCHFRSRLEARYAVFFDAMGIRWDYEWEAFLTPSGAYLPDFYLHLKRPTVFEVKPESLLGAPVDPRWAYIPRYLATRFVVAYGLPRRNELDPDQQTYGGNLREMDKDGLIPGGLAFSQCPVDGSVALELDGHVEYTCGHTGSCALFAWVSTTRLVEAFDAARSYRFEPARVP